MLRGIFNDRLRIVTGYAGDLTSHGARRPAAAHANATASPTYRRLTPVWVIFLMRTNPSSVGGIPSRTTCAFVQPPGRSDSLKTTARDLLWSFWGEPFSSTLAHSIVA